MSVTVITPAVSSALTTVANVRTDLGLPDASLPNDRVQRFIDQASARAASFCRRTFGRETVRERIDVRYSGERDDEPGLLLDRSPVVSIASVEVDGTLQEPGAYEVEGRFLYRVGSGARRRWYGQVVVVTYEAGWLLPGEERGDPPTTASDLPADVERAVIQLVGVAASAAGRDMMVKSESVEGVGRTDWYVQGAAAALPHPEAEATLTEYRRLIFG